MSKKKRYIYLLIIFISFSFSSFAYENKILVKIGEEIITSIDVNNETKYLLALNKNIRNLDKNEIFKISKKSIIKEKIQKIEILKNFKTPRIPEKYLEQILQNVYQRIGIKSLDKFKIYLKNNDINYGFVKDKIETEALWNELIVAKFSSKIKVNEEDIREKIINDGKKFTKSYLMSEIFFEITNKDQLTKFVDKINKTIIEKGFDNAALKYSISNTSSVGGKLDWINEDSLNKNLKNILSNMRENEFTDPITVPGGFLILKINEIKKIKKNQDIEKEIKKIINKKRNNQLNQFSKMYFNKIKKNIQINEI